MCFPRPESTESRREKKDGLFGVVGGSPIETWRGEEAADEDGVSLRGADADGLRWGILVAGSALCTDLRPGLAAEEGNV